jgi:signal transduction histidine kinase
MTPHFSTLSSDPGDDAESLSRSAPMTATEAKRLSAGQPAPEEFIASLAHEISQPLGALLSELHAAQQVLTRDGQVSPALASIHNAARSAERAVETVRLMRELTRGDSVTTSPQTEVNATAREALDAMAPEAARTGVDLRFHAAEGLPAAAIHPRQFEQVLVNLVRNAIQAMTESADRPAEPTVHVATRPAATGVMVRVDDTGPGVGADVAERVFEPFYTTRRAGTGLGLTICRRIVASHGGTLVCRRNDRGGARLEISLKATDPGRVREAG